MTLCLTSERDSLSRNKELKILVAEHTTPGHSFRVITIGISSDTTHMPVFCFSAVVVTVKRELEGRFVLSHFLRSNTVACAKAEYHGGEGSVKQRDTTHGGQEVRRQRRTWTTWFLAHTSRCVFQCLSYFIPQRINAKDSLACKGTCQRPASPHQLLSVTFLQVYKDQECLLMTADICMSKHPGNRQAGTCTTIQCPLDQS